MQNFVQQGNTITLVSPAVVKSGDGVLVQNMFGIAAFDAKPGDSLELVLDGVFVLPKALVDIPQGARLYWDDVAKNVTTVSSGTTLIGVATLRVSDTDPEVAVRLNGAF